MRHKMTFSHFSKDLIRPNLGGESKRDLYSEGRRGLFIRVADGLSIMTNLG